jgi:hypothetical protein
VGDALVSRESPAKGNRVTARQRSFTLAITQLDDIPEKSEIIRLVQDAIEKKKSATALRTQDDE